MAGLCSYTDGRCCDLGTPPLGERILALHPIGRLGTLDEIAEAVLWLSCDKSSFVTGQSLVADGGLTLG